MATQYNNLVDTKTEDENHQTEETKPGISYDSTILQNNVPKAQFGCKVCPKSFQLVTDLLKHFKVHVHPERNNPKEQTFQDVAQNLKCENENSKMDIEGTVIKVELKPPLTQIHKPNVGLENTNNKKEQSVEIKHENQTDDHEQNRIALTIREAICYCTIIVRDAKVLQHPEGVISSQGAKPRGMK